MLVTSSGKRTIPLSSPRQRNIPQGRKRGEFGIRPQEMSEVTNVSARHCCLLFVIQTLIHSLSHISFTQQHPPNHNWQTKTIQILLPLSIQRFILSSFVRNTLKSHSLSRGDPVCLPLSDSCHCAPVFVQQWVTHKPSEF